MSGLTAAFLGLVLAVLIIRLGYVVRDLAEKYVFSKMKRIDKDKKGRK
jgi:hypothetical protein